MKLKVSPPRQLGHRGTVLLIVGIFWVLIGVGTLLASEPIDLNRMLLHERIPLPVRAALWGTTGLVAMVFAFRRRPGADVWGYVALILLPAERVVSYLFAWGWSWFTPIGLPGGWLAVVVWLAILALIVTIAGWPEPRSNGVEDLE